MEIHVELEGDKEKMLANVNKQTKSLDKATIKREIELKEK